MNENPTQPLINPLVSKDVRQQLERVQEVTDKWPWMWVIAAYTGAFIIFGILLHIFFKFLSQRHVASELARSVHRLFLPILLFLYCAPLIFLTENLEMPALARDVIHVGVKVGTIASVVAFMIRFLNLLTAIYYSRLRIDVADNLRARRMQTQVKFLEQLADVFFIFLGIGAVLFSFERFRSFGGSLLASAGLASVIVCFAAQKSLGNLIAGFQIAFTQPVRLGDAVLVENEWGWIEEITLTYVVVKIWDLRRLVLPITYFLEKPFQNWTRTSADLIGSVLLWVDYTVPLEALRAELQRVVESTELWDRQTVNLQVVDTTDRSINLRILVSAHNSSDAWDLRCYVREKILVYLQRNYPEALPRTRFENFASRPERSSEVPFAGPP